MKLNDLYENWENGGVISDLSAVHELPWADEFETIPMGLDYHGNHSGDKTPTPLLMKLANGAPLSVSDRQKIARIIWGRFGKSWAKIWETRNLEYNPIWNVDGTETRTTTTTHTGTDTTTNTGTETTTHDTTDTTTHTGDDTLTHNTQSELTKAGSETNTKTGSTKDTYTNSSRENQTSAYNSDSYAPESKTIESPGDHTETYNSIADALTFANRKDTDKKTGTEKTTHDTTDTNTKTGDDTLTHNTQSELEHDTTDHTTDIFERHGNIGVTSTQKLINEERELWLVDFYEMVYTNIDTILCLDVYDY